MNNSNNRPTHFQIHWHVFFTHFPLALFGVTFLFQILHLYSHPQCFELASIVTLVAGLATLVPTTLTGYLTWKHHYHGARVPIFQRKIAIALVLLAVGIPLCLWRILYVGTSQEAALPGIHWSYFSGTAFMCVGSLLEGYYGGRLSHRPRIPFSNHNRTD